MKQEGKIHLGTSAFTAAGWPGTFYPEGMKPAQYLTYYATQFETVEVDSTFYRIPSLSTVRGWYAKTPKGFLFAAKVPQEVTHKKVLVDCEAEMKKFLATMDCLGEKLGPLLFQFGYFNKKAFLGVNDFLARLRPFLKALPKGYKFAVEIRNRNWLAPQFVEALRERGAALALVDQAWMPRPTQVFEKLDPITADFTYIRWLGDRKGIEEQTKVWNRTIVDRRVELEEWAKICQRIQNRQRIQIYAYANNHYGGFAPETIGVFRRLLGKQEPRQPQKSGSLFSK
jgi:uncharacterized protein YecE (DUF72 family)